MTYEFIRYETRHRVAFVTINRPERLNALHPPASAELREAFVSFRDDPELWVAVLTGAGDRAFCTGNDLKYASEHARPGEPYPESDTIPFGGITGEFTCWKPIIAAVNGYALGGGLEIALACDIIIAEEHARFGTPEVKVGLAAVAGGVHRLPRQLPQKIALGMLLSGGTISAQEAHRWGLANEVAPPGDLMRVAQRWAAAIVDGAPLSVRASKQMAMAGLDLPLKEAMTGSYSEYEKAVTSQDWVEGPRAFAEKRKPQWKGA